MLRHDALLQESIDRLGSYSDEPKQPPAKQPWKRPGFGPPPRMSAVRFGDRPAPPPAGGTEDPSVAGPMPDEDDVPAMIPVEAEAEPEPTTSDKPPPPPPPGATDADPEAREPTDGAGTDAADGAGVDTADRAGTDGDADEEGESDEIVGGADDVAQAVVRGPRVLELPPELADEVRELMRHHQEVAAVRLVCDAMNVGILDAQRTVRALVGR